ncbi:formyltetrahydrofolate deformylase [Leucobacter allii]|uniref:formyltetrahydrofolate deformylase n=1 Tax=Leucobacter allii TaxID=2932247 RepID=UPI003D287553
MRVDPLPWYLVNTIPAAAAPSETQWVLTLSCTDGPGIVHAISGAVVAAGGNIAESQQFASADTGSFFMRLQVEAVAEPETFEARFAEALAPVTERYRMSWRLDTVGRPVRTLILASTATHCVNDLLYRGRGGQLPIEVPLILSNHETVRDIAEFYDVPFEHRAIAGADDKAAFEARVLEAVAEHDIELVVLARYMQILSPGLCEALAGRAINIHHSFLPGFKGANPYKQAHRRGVKLIGATAHFVTTDLDEGPIIEQDVVRVDHADSPRELTQLGQDVEARVLRHAVRSFAENRVLADGARTIIF